MSWSKTYCILIASDAICIDDYVEQNYMDSDLDEWMSE